MNENTTMGAAWLLTLCVLASPGPPSALGADADEHRPGLAGAQYDDEAFTEVDEDPNILDGLDRHWAAARGNDWRAARASIGLWPCSGRWSATPPCGTS